jgi:anti-sigma regulatory factor (Ser/Thr protein kinase)
VRHDDEPTPAVIVLARGVQEVGRSRRWLREVLGGGADRRQVDDACLVMSELVTNALRHGLGRVVVHTSTTVDGTVRLSVTDWTEDAPQLLPADPARVGGLGMHVVDALAGDWGVAAFPGGKTVWAWIPRSPTSSADQGSVQDVAEQRP